MIVKRRQVPKAAGTAFAALAASGTAGNLR